MTSYGYARERSAELITLQMEALAGGGIPADAIYQDAEGLGSQRPGFHALLASLQRGDEIVISHEGHLARTPAQVRELASILARAGVSVRTVDGYPAVDIG
jgi:DNA invertase Pin-like site-specific DNA recombinase